MPERLWRAGGRGGAPAAGAWVASLGRPAARLFQAEAVSDVWAGENGLEEMSLHVRFFVGVISSFYFLFPCQTLDLQIFMRWREYFDHAARSLSPAYTWALPARGRPAGALADPLTR